MRYFQVWADIHLMLLKYLCFSLHRVFKIAFYNQPQLCIMWIGWLLFQRGGSTVISGGRSAVNQVVQDVLDSAVQQSISDGGESCVCHICSLQLKNPKSLRDHIRGTHLAIKAHRCNICGESFQWPMQVARHKKRVHGADGNQLMIF